MNRWITLICCLMLALCFAVTGTAAADDGVLTLPADLITIEAEAFSGVVSANKVIVQEGATTIGAGAFEDGLFFEIHLPSTVTEIGAGAFRNCGKPGDPARYYIVPEGVTFGEQALENCRATIYYNGAVLPYFEYTLTDDSATIIGMNGFASIQEARVPDTIDGKPVSSIKNTLRRATIPDTVQSIGNNAFDGCSLLEDIDLPAGLTSIGNYAFRNTALTAVMVPERVTVIGKNAFESAKQLVTVTLPEGLTTIGEKAFNDCYALEQVNIPSTVTEIGVAAFRYNKALPAITIPAGITALANEAFSGCEQLVSVQLPAGLTELGEYAFWKCDKLTEISFPADLTTIGKNCFENACRTYNGNPVYELPESLATIGGSAFYNCGAGLAVARGGSVEILMKENGYEFTYQDGNEFRYKYFSATAGGETVWTLKLTGYKGEGGAVEIPAGPTVIAERALFNNDTVTSVTIPDGVVTIERWAFEQCDGLTEAVMSDTVTTVLSGAFKSCPKLTDVTFSTNLTKLDGDVFQKSCKGQTGIHCYNLPDGLAEFDRYTFDGCEAVLCVRRGTAAETGIRANNYVFTYSYPDRMDFRYRQDGQKLTLWEYAGNDSPVILPDDCEAVRKAGFSDLQAEGLVCSQMSDTAAALSQAGLTCTFPGHGGLRYQMIDGILYLMGYAGTDTQIMIPKAAAYVEAGVDIQIRDSAFAENTAITKVVIPEGYSRINSKAFYHCSMLTDITLPDSLKSMGTSVFAQCGTAEAAPKPITLVLPDNMTDLVGRGGGDCTFIAFNALLVCGKTSPTAALLTDRNYVYTAPGEKDFRYRYESYTEGVGEAAVTGRRLWLVGYEGTAETVEIPSGIYGIKQFVNNRTSDYARTFHAYAFTGNTAVTSVKIPDGTVEIGNKAFLECVNLTDITFPDSLMILRNEAFRYCGSASGEIHYYVLPDDMTEIGTNISSGWGSFADINNGRIVCAAGSNTAKVVSDAGSEWQAGYTFALKGHQTDGLLYKYENWKNEAGEAQPPRLILMKYEGTASELTIPSGCGIYRIERDVFKNRTGLQKISIPEGVVGIGENAFYGCTLYHYGSLPTVDESERYVIDLPDTLKSAGAGAFNSVGSGYTAERFYLVLPASLTDFDVDMLAGCNAVMVAPAGSEAAGKLYEGWWYYYTSLEDAVRQTSCQYKRYIVDNVEQEHYHYGKR